MGDVEFRVVPADMEADAAKWGSAADSLREAHRAVPALGIAFGGFESVVGSKYTAADLAVQNVLEVGANRLRATATNVVNNSGRTKKNDADADGRVRKAGGGGGDQGSAVNPSDHGGGKGKDHYAGLLGSDSVPTNPMPTDPKDPDITFDRHVDPTTGEVTWTPREMKPGEAVAVDGRDVERIPQRADRIVVTMVDGEPQITYVDTDAAPVGGRGSVGEAQWEAAPVADPDPDPNPAASRVVAGSGAQEPQPQPQPQVQTEWSRDLPEGADYAVVEVRDGEPHLVFLDVEGNEVTQVADTVLDDRADAPQKEAVR